MVGILEKYIPNVISNRVELWESVLQTLVMVSIAGIISLFFGLIIGVLLAVTGEGKILESKGINYILDKFINIFRSIPFIILLTALIPFTRFIVGTSIGTEGAIIPLIFGTIPFLARQVETSLYEVDEGLIEAAEAMGSSPREIIFRVYLREGMAGIVRGVTITFISLIGLSAMAGSIGGGGLGDFAIRYGYQRSLTDITYVTIVILLIIVSLVQAIGNFIIRKVSH